MNKKIKVVYIISNIQNRVFQFEWQAEKIDKTKFDIFFILLNSKISPFESFLIEKKIPVIRINYTSKKNIIYSFFKCYLILKKIKPHIIHTHLFEASLIGLTAAKFAGIKKRVYTRHHSDSNISYAPNAVKYDKFINKMSTSIIAISENVKNILITLEQVSPEKIKIIEHGIDLEEVDSISETRIEKLKLKYNSQNQKPVIGVISRYIKLKGLEYVIDAFSRLLLSYPSARLLLFNCKGNYSPIIKEKLKKLPSSNYLEVEFEEDLYALYKIFDIYIHTPIDSRCEAFGQTYIEALVTKTPSIFTLSGIANDFIENKRNALVVDYKNSENIYNAIKELLTNNNLVCTLVQNGEQDVRRKFNINEKIKELEAYYISL
ncbi:MAG: glycosyltransferase family 4 protein [Bacteroidetes bacterium]|nr:glycosyltransferase family 4 protein [Bacteroidota bacterium]